ncbi:MAG: hypothetical protein ACRDZ1_12560 [Acidimicrobiia bacterium]
MKAVVIGPGRIGCGFVGQLLRSANHEVVFVGRGPVVDLLGRRRRYRVRLIDGTAVEEIGVDGVDAVNVDDTHAVLDHLASAQLVATAVGAGNLSRVTPLLAMGIARARQPTNVIAFENLSRAGTWLRGQVARHLPVGFPLDEHGFSGAVVSRAVSHRLWPRGPSESLVLVGDRPCTFHVDRAALREPLPALAGMIATGAYQAWERRKRCMYSAGHAATAYLGSLKGYHYIHTAIRDPEIRSAVRVAMAEGQRGLRARYGPGVAGDETDLDAILARFDNAALSDPIARVGRDPRRKLHADDRLVGAARLAADGGTRPEMLALAITAALCFDDPCDPGAAELHSEIERLGIAPVLRSVCGLRPDRGVGRVVAEQWRALAPGWGEGNLLLSLRSRMWAVQAAAS